MADESLRLEALGGSGFLPAATLLVFRAAPDEPVTADWTDTFDFGPPWWVQPIDPSLREDSEVREQIRRMVTPRERDRRHAARARLEAAWRAAP